MFIHVFIILSKGLLEPYKALKAKVQHPGLCFILTIVRIAIVLLNIAAFVLLSPQHMMSMDILINVTLICSGIYL